MILPNFANFSGSDFKITLIDELDRNYSFDKKLRFDLTPPIVSLTQESALE